MEGYKIEVTIKRVITVYEDEFIEDDDLGREFNEYNATQFAIGIVANKLQDEPNYPNTKIIEHFKYQLK